MLGKAFYFILLLFQTTGVAAHSLEEVNQVFAQEPIPIELVELTKELDITVGVKSVREQAHAKQHQILEEHVRARTERQCAESLTTISRLDEEIVDLQERGQHQEAGATQGTRYHGCLHCEDLRPHLIEKIGIPFVLKVASSPHVMLCCLLHNRSTQRPVSRVEVTVSRRL